MEKLLDAIASGLDIRGAEEKDLKVSDEYPLIIETDWYDYKEVSQEVIELFKKELINHLIENVKKLDVGEHVDYGFEYDSKPLGTLIEGANDNLAEMLLKLPALDEGESYELPEDTYVRFTVTRKNNDKVIVMPDRVSPWIMGALVE